ncbi:MAG: glycosyltransferase family 4 protein, partial [Acidimicrobiales bacterium]
RPLWWSWGRFGIPHAELFVGAAQVVHGTNFVVPPTRHAARIATVHDLTVLRFPQMCDGATLAYPAFLRSAVKSGAFFHTPSRFVADELVEMLGVPRERVRAVHSGVPIRPVSEPGEPPPVLLPKGTQRYVLSVATAEPRKDLPGLVAAFDSIAGDRGDLALVLAGRSGWGEADLGAALQGARWASRIVRTGWVDSVGLASLIASAAVLAYPSRYEGFGFPPLEAMAMGVPVVSTRAGAIPEVVGEAGVLVPVGDPEALATALAGVLDSPERAQGLKDAGRKRAAAFSWSACAEGLVSLYRDAIDDRDGARTR